MKPILLCLHGWGGSKQSFAELRTALKNDDIEILTPDLPGFGSEPEPTRPWTNDDYADWVENWLKKSGKLEAISGKLYLLGHSHGGRIALKLANRESVTSHKSQVTSKLRTHSSQLIAHSFHIEHLFLCAPAGIRHARHFKRIIGLLLAKTGSFFLAIPGLNILAPIGKKLLYRLVRVHDYEIASPVMRQTMINVAREDLRPLLSSIALPTDLFWGKDDGMTPFSDALIMERELPHATLHAFEGVRHRVHRDKAREIAEVIREKILGT